MYKDRIPNTFTITPNMLHIYPGGSYNMVEGRGYELDVAKLHLLQCYIQSQINYMCENGELRKDYKADELMAIARGLYDGKFKDIVENYSLWKVEFNPGEYFVPEILTSEGWEDISWHNDTCPRFHNETLGLVVCVEADKPENREDEDYARFVVEQVTGNNNDGIEYVNTLYECEYEDSLLEFLNEYVELRK